MKNTKPINREFIYIDGDKQNCFKIYKNINYTLTNGKEIIIPKGMETDFATIPRFFWRIFPPHLRKYRRAAVVHDYLYLTEKEITSRSYADAEFRRILIRDKTPKIVAWLFWLAVKLFGNKRWENYKK